MSAVSSPTASTRGTRAAVGASARSSRASRSTSCALGGSGPRGGRRSTSSDGPQRRRNVTLEWPSPSGCAVSAPAPASAGTRPCSARNACSGSRTSSGSRALAAAAACVATTSSEAGGALMAPHANHRAPAPAPARPAAGPAQPCPTRLVAVPNAPTPAPPHRPARAGARLAGRRLTQPVADVRGAARPHDAVQPRERADGDQLLRRALAARHPHVAVGRARGRQRASARTSSRPIRTPTTGASTSR